MIIVVLSKFKGTRVLRMYSNQHCLFVFSIVTWLLYIQRINNILGGSLIILLHPTPIVYNFLTPQTILYINKNRHHFIHSLFCFHTVNIFAVLGCLYIY